MLYKRPLRKEKEVVTFLIKDKMVKLAWDLRIEPHIYQSKATEWALVRGQAVSLPLAQSSRLPPHWHSQDVCPEARLNG